MKTPGLWWGPPQNFDERKYERKISWLELFYDLVYVACIGQITHQIAVSPTWDTMGFSLLLFSMIFWSWINGSQYYDLHGGEGIRTRLLTFWQMLAVAAVAITIPETFKGQHQNFTLAFLALQVLITYLWWSVGFYDPSHRVFNKFYTTNYVTSSLLLGASYFTGQQTATILWIVVLILNLLPPLTGAKTIVTILKERGQVFSASAALVERFGLFTIIVLAESILGTVTGFAEVKDKQLIEWLVVLLAILIAFLLWCLYFDMTSEQETKKGYNYLLLLCFLHFPLLASLSVVGACLKVFLAEVAAGLPLQLHWMFCISLAIIVWSITALTKIMLEEEEDRAFIGPVARILVYSGLGLPIVPLFKDYLSTLNFLAIVALILLLPVCIGIRGWVKFKFGAKQPG
ncbi:MAG: low temperature requirement protein A [Bacteroidota bacterium]